MRVFKGFDKDLKCQGHQFAIGKTEEETGISLCKKGFHSCENPLDVLRYYQPGESRFCEVDADGKIIKATDDTKICSERITIGAEITLKSMIEFGVKFLFEKIKNAKPTSGY